jgi:uncharacterized protein YdhG (YjbR/CyaY superfamily)
MAVERRRKAAASQRPKRAGMTTSATTIDEYLAGVRPDFRATLTKVRKTIRAAAPRATEGISYGIPTYKHNDRALVYFAAAKNHCAIHAVGQEHLDAATRQGFGVGRGSIRFTPEKPLPDAFVKRIIKDRLAELEAGATAYKSRAKRR